MMWTSGSFPAEWLGRLVAVDDVGVVHPPTVDTTRLRSPIPASVWFGEQAVFRGVALSRIKGFRFQTRRCQWVGVRNISLQPGQHTQVGIVDAGAK